MTGPETHLLESGQTLVNVHPRLECVGEWCPIHRPMPGPWSNWPRQWSDERDIMERVCPHGIGHPVAEMYQWAMERGRGFDLVHGCCSSCICSPACGQASEHGRPYRRTRHSHPEPGVRHSEKCGPDHGGGAPAPGAGTPPPACHRDFGNPSMATDQACPHPDP